MTMFRGCHSRTEKSCPSVCLAVWFSIFYSGVGCLLLAGCKSRTLKGPLKGLKGITPFSIVGYKVGRPCESGVCPFTARVPSLYVMVTAGLQGLNSVEESWKKAERRQEEGGRSKPQPQPQPPPQPPGHQVLPGSPRVCRTLARVESAAGGAYVQIPVR